MNVLIIEDEENLARQLKRLLLEIDDSLIVKQIAASVKDSLKFLQHNPQIDLIFADIYLNDGLSFQIFDEIGCPAPIIFCTAYDQYAIKAFELDSVDYLLKPIKKENLAKAIQKYKRLYGEQSAFTNLEQRINSISEKLLSQQNYRKSFLLTYKDRLVPVGIDEISYFQSEHGLTKCLTTDKRLFPIEMSLDALEEALNPLHFYRANRKYLISRKAIADAAFYFNGRLSLNMRPQAAEAIIISKAKATEFKQWMKQGA